MIHVRDEIKKLSQWYTDKIEEHFNILAINLMRDAKTLYRLKKNYLKTYVSNRSIIYRAYATGHILFKIFTNCQIYY